MNISLDTRVHNNYLHEITEYIECIVVMTSIFESESYGGYQHGAHAVKCILFVESLYALVAERKCTQYLY